MSPAARTRGPAWARIPIASALALAACAPTAPPPAAAAPAWPAGTVLALNADPILAADVDAIASIVARAEGQHALPHLRRIALTNVVLPLVATRQVAGAEKRAAALAAAQAWRAARVDGAAAAETVPAPIEEVVEGGFGMVGLEVWNWALDCPPGSWSEPIETPGAWRVARVLERSAGLRPCDVVLKADLATFVWDHAESFRKDVEAHLDRSKLDYVDEAWRDLVPTLWQRRLRGSP